MTGFNMMQFRSMYNSTTEAGWNSCDARHISVRKVHLFSQVKRVKGGLFRRWLTAECWTPPIY